MLYMFVTRMKSRLTTKLAITCTPTLKPKPIVELRMILVETTETSRNYNFDKGLPRSRKP